MGSPEEAFPKCGLPTACKKRLTEGASESVGMQQFYFFVFQTCTSLCSCQAAVKSKPEAKTPSLVTSEVIGVACAERGQSVGQKRRILHRVASNSDCPFPGLSRLLKKVGGPEEAACDLESRRCVMPSCDGCGRIVHTMQHTHVALAIHLNSRPRPKRLHRARIFGASRGL